ncbi:MAG: isovaleryl-CoA dehydrogenase [Candidatus Hydrogenedentes bacterium]|nr:isovaleryl-CoA dehydrogenase [Candidatus Hydrogenedentota bacterium]
MLQEDVKHVYATHEVENQPPPLENYNLFESDPVLVEGLRREGAAWAEDRVDRLGALMGSAEIIEQGFLANENPPELHTHDRFGERIDEVRYHPAYHRLMTISIEAQAHALPWTEPQRGAHVARAISKQMIDQIEAGSGCPITMTFAVVPALRHQPEIAEVWIPRATSAQYDPRFIPADQKSGVIMGMAMTEKQGGSDVRSNTTRAVPLGPGGPGQEYELTGHKWFCSAPMSDAFLTLANTEVGLTCFLVPRFLPDGTKNRIYIQRLKDKLGNRSNASSEIEFCDTWGQMLGEEGRGVATILDMVSHTRLDCAVGTSALMRQAVAQAMHHTAHRSAFGKRLAQQPIMKNVLADLAIESEATTTNIICLAAAYDEAVNDPAREHFVRLATAVTKYWVCKRAPHHIYEALECHGGLGYVEESIMPRLYREAPLSSIWEGSGNVMCLDVLRAMSRQPESVTAFVDELDKAKGGDKRLDAAVDALRDTLSHADGIEEMHTRRLVERMALALQGSYLVRHAPAFVADAFCASRFDAGRGQEYGTLPAGLAFDEIIQRATPTL